MTVGSALFATVGGLRGALSLVMAQMVVASLNQEDLAKKDRAVAAQVRPSPVFAHFRLPSPVWQN